MPDKDACAVILKQVDFKKERLLLFCWSGSGRERITPASGKPREAWFEFTAGKTDDFSHGKLFA